MASTGQQAGRSRNLILLAMIFAVSMTFIDTTIVSIAIPKIQTELGLSSTGSQWAVNGYLIAMAAMFAFGGRLADTLGHRKMVTLGVVIFALASAMCGLTPHDGLAQAWIVLFRAVQGLGGAIMFPAALAIVVQTFPLRERGRKLALFFAAAGAFTAVGPILGGVLTQWTWRGIFWVNIPVAALALIMIAISKPETSYQPARMDYRGLALISIGVGLSVFGFQQASILGWHNPLIPVSIVAGVVLLVLFFRIEARTAVPLMHVSIFRDRAFLTQCLVLFITNLVFIPMFFFGSEYAQISLGYSASKAGVILMYFFIGFVIASQIGGRLLDRVGAKRPVVVGCVLGACGFIFWAQNVTTLNFSKQEWMIVLAGAGMGFMLGPSSTDAVNRAGRLTYGEATGITQTVRNFAACMGLAILGTISVTVTRSKVTSSLIGLGVPSDKAHAQAAAGFGAASQSQSQSGSGSLSSIPHWFQLDFAQSTQTVLYIMGAVMAAAAVVALIGLRGGVQKEATEQVPAAARVTAD
jgi:EmrB/QacA subfamily drug resistance transporter